ncbi:alpha/beta hydrolase [Streptomyces sp. KS 21]|uniref:alpha/beta hydrolase n=1 Tax=Streptomyces sp. KS 21 TaxID=2485150 RepID=UPI003262FD2E
MPHSCPIRALRVGEQRSEPVLRRNWNWRQLPGGMLLTFRGPGHTAYGRSACVTDAVDAYLLDLKPVPDGKTC